MAIKLDRRERYSSRPTIEPGDNKLILSIVKGFGSPEALASWEDDRRLESQLTDAAIAIVVAAETFHRERALRQHAWRIERKADLEEAIRQHKEAAARAERERLERLEQARIDRLLADAKAFE